MVKIKSKKVREIIEKLPNPKLLTVLAIGLILGVIIYLTILLLTLK